PARARGAGSGHSFIFDVAQDRLWDIDPAGTAMLGSTVGGIGGGGNCGDSGGVGLIARADGAFFAGSPANNMVYTLSADGMTRTDLHAVNQPVAIDLDGAGGAWV